MGIDKKNKLWNPCGMSKTYRDWNPLQPYLLPPSPQEWLAKDHLAYFLVDVVCELDLRVVEARYENKDARGTRPYDPRMMTALLIYGYCIGKPSSRQLERATYEDVAVRVIVGDNHPDHSRISEFRRVNLKELAALFVQVLQLCQRAGLVKLGCVALDGTKVKADASKHKAMSYGRMHKTEAELEAEVKCLLAEAEQVDRDEDTRYGKNRRGDELPDELRRRQDRLAAIRKAKRELEAEAAAARARQLAEQEKESESRADREPPGEKRNRMKARADVAKRKGHRARQGARRKAGEAGMVEPDTEPPNPDRLPSHQVPSNKDGEPTDKAQRNFTDPDSRIMKRDGTYLQGYNSQAAVDAEHQIIVAQAVTNQAPDQEHLRPMLRQLEDNCHAMPAKLLADAGYWSEHNYDYCRHRGIDSYIAADRLQHGETPPAVRGPIPKDLDAKGLMRRKLRTRKGRATYARRKVIVEPVFGQIKRRFGRDRFSMRGLDKVRGEWALLCLSHNLLKLFRAQPVPC